ncbi:MAG: DUF3316 domain-containing protein [Muribaculaceae bacterium]|nr:DUF3316 domain-containing protein [Muribaculaceae bacterium]
MIKRILTLLYVISAMTFLAEAAMPSDTTDYSLPPLRPVLSSYTLRSGSSHMADTYLSPLKYSGWDVGFNYTRSQAMKFNPRAWVMQLSAGVIADRTVNPARNATMWYWGADFSWSMIRRWRLTSELSAGVGGSALISAGCMYTARNGNNPASAKASVMVGATAYAAWNGRIARIPVTLRYQPVIPVTGAFFAPDYGELYYEIYLGNHSGLVHPAWWGNYFKLDHTLTADVHLGSTSLRIGYAGGIYTTRINDITTRRFTHAAVIGISGEWLSVNPSRRISDKAAIISSRY